MNDDLYKFPRLYVTHDLSDTVAVALEPAQAHYLRNVMRKNVGDAVRLFNGTHGEWLCELEVLDRGNAIARPTRQTKEQRNRNRRLHLFFAPLKKDRLHVLVEKAVELDATDLHPIITDRTEVRDVKEDKLNAYITEAAEQCERLDVPILHPVQKLNQVMDQGFPIIAGIERSDAQALCDAIVPSGDCGAIIGPVGGWSDDERDLLSGSKGIMPVTLGPNVLRSETAVAVILARLSLPSG